MNIHSYCIDQSSLISELEKLQFEKKEFISGSFDAFHEILQLNFQCSSFDLDEEFVYWITYNISSRGIEWDYNGNIENEKWKRISDNGGSLSWKFMDILKNQWLHNTVFVAAKLRTTTTDLFSFPTHDLPNISMQDFKTKFRNTWCNHGVILLRVADGKLCHCKPNLENDNADTLSFFNQEDVTTNYDNYSKEFAIVSIFDSKFVDFSNANFDGEKFDINIPVSKSNSPGYNSGFSDSEFFANEMHPDYDDAKARRNIDKAYNGED